MSTLFEVVGLCLLCVGLFLVAGLGPALMLAGIAFIAAGIGTK